MNQYFPLLGRVLCKDNEHNPMNLQTQNLPWGQLEENVLLEDIIKGNRT